MQQETILIVDDVTSNIQTIIEHLESSGRNYELLSATNGDQATHIAEKLKPDLILTDWEMPKMSGLELIKKLKTNPLTSNIPFIMVTGVRTTSEDLKIALDSGAVDFLSKPVNKVELWARVASVLSLFKSYNLIKQQKKEIEDYKDRQLSIKALEVVQKNQALILIKKKLHKYMLDLDIDQRPEIKNIINLIQSNTNNEMEWEKFKLHFEGVHPSFFNHLELQYPSLTVNDQKLCAYMRIGLSNKEISLLLNITQESARKNKTRLKKKLNLSAEDQINDFVRNINF